MFFTSHVYMPYIQSHIFAGVWSRPVVYTKKGYYICIRVCPIIEGPDDTQQSPRPQQSHCCTRVNLIRGYTRT